MESPVGTTYELQSRSLLPVGPWMTDSNNTNNNILLLLFCQWIVVLVIAYSDYGEMSSRQNYDHHRVNGRHSQNGFATRDHDDDDEAVILPVKGHDEMPRRSESPVLRPLPSMLYCYISL